MANKNLSISILLGIILIACNRQVTQQEQKAYTFSGDTVYLNSNLLSDKIIIDSVRIEPFVKEVITSGTVQAIPTQFAYVAPPFSGRIVKSYIRLGQHVKVNDPLFELVSPNFTSAQKDFYKAQSELKLALKELQRKQDLLHNGVGSQKELDEAENILLIAEKEYLNAKAALNIYQTNPDKMMLGQAMVIRAPISGNILENNIITGQYITSEGDPVANIADLSKVWIVAQVKEKDIRFIHEGDEMDIQISALPGKSIKGIVYHVDESVDQETRSIKVLSVCDNKDGLLKVGMYTTVHFLDKPADCITIPEKALLQNEKGSFVYVQLKTNSFVRTPVETEIGKNGNAIVTKGLDANDKIICEGGYYIK